MNESLHRSLFTPYKIFASHPNKIPKFSTRTTPIIKG